MGLNWIQKRRRNRISTPLRRLVAENVEASRDHFSFAATVGSLVSKSNERFAVDIDIVAALSRGIGIGTTADGVNARIVFTAGTEAVDKDVG